MAKIQNQKCFEMKCYKYSPAHFSKLRRFAGTRFSVTWSFEKGVKKMPKYHNRKLFSDTLSLRLLDTSYFVSIFDLDSEKGLINSSLKD